MGGAYSKGGDYWKEGIKLNHYGMYIYLQSGGVIDLFLTERSIKEGFCPVIKEPRTGSCTSKCSSDNDCKGMQKCCNVTGCGKTCQEPYFMSM